MNDSREDGQHLHRLNDTPCTAFSPSTVEAAADTPPPEACKVATVSAPTAGGRPPGASAADRIRASLHQPTRRKRIRIAYQSTGPHQCRPHRRRPEPAQPTGSGEPADTSRHAPESAGLHRLNAPDLAVDGGFLDGRPTPPPPTRYALYGQLSTSTGAPPA